MDYQENPGYRAMCDLQRGHRVSIRALRLAQEHAGNSYIPWSAFNDITQASFLAIADDEIPMVSDEDVSEYMEFCTTLVEGRTEYVRG